jgi:hypothetical protein
MFFKVKERDLRRHSRAFTLFDREMATFSDELTLLLVCAHGCKHGWAQMSWVADTARIIETGKIDWDTLFSLADKCDVKNMLLVGLSLANQMMGAPLPEQVIARITGPCVIESTNEVISAFLARPAEPEWKLLKIWLYWLHLQEGWQRRASLLFDLFTHPTLDEWLRVQLPEQVQFLYYWLRPMFLFVDHVPRVIFRLLTGGYDAQMNIRREVG